MIFAICIAIAMISILLIAGWFFYSINEYQKRIDNDTD